MAKGGRPLKFKSVKKLEKRIKEYFEDCDPHIKKVKVIEYDKKKKKSVKKEKEILTTQKPYTISGLAYFLGVDRKTLLNYENKEKFFHTIKKAKARCEKYAEEYLYQGKNAAGVIFSLKNNYGWKDREREGMGEGLAALFVQIQNINQSLVNAKENSSTGNNELEASVEEGALLHARRGSVEEGEVREKSKGQKLEASESVLDKRR